MAGRGVAGGIWGLLELIEEHRPALRYDWRNRFGKSLDSIPDEFDWAETLDLVRVLRADPSSQFFASIEGMRYALSREGWMLADLIDIQGGKAMGKKWDPYPRPLPSADEPTVNRRGNAAGQTPEQVKERLRLMAQGHAERLPV